MKIDIILSEVQKLARVRTIRIDDMVKAFDYINKCFKISNKALEGTSVVVDLNAQDFAKSYKGVPESTIFEAVYKNGNWKITNIYRGRTKTYSKRIECDLSDTAKEAILKNHKYL